jgi:hypothetical protein
MLVVVLEDWGSVLVGAVVLVVLLVEVDAVLEDLVPFGGFVVVVVEVEGVVAPSTDWAAAMACCMAAMSVWY